MSANEFYRSIGIDGYLAPLNKKLDKKSFYDHADLNKKEKDVITKYIQRMELAYLLTPSTVNIQPFINEEYHYEGIMFITVHLRDEVTDKQVSVIDDVIHSALPNPAVIVFDWEEKLLISTGLKRLNKVDTTNVVLEYIHRSGWLNVEENDETTRGFLDTIHLSNVRFSNFFDFYQDLDMAVVALQNVRVTGKYNVAKSQEEYEEQQKVIQQIQELEQEITKHKTAMKKESQFNKKVEMNMQIQKLIKKSVELIKALDK
jgi:hypothetical protein